MSNGSELCFNVRSSILCSRDLQIWPNCYCSYLLARCWLLMSGVMFGLYANFSWWLLLIPVPSSLMLTFDELYDVSWICIFSTGSSWLCFLDCCSLLVVCCLNYICYLILMRGQPLIAWLSFHKFAVLYRTGPSFVSLYVRVSCVLVICKFDPTATAHNIF